MEWDRWNSIIKTFDCGGGAVYFYFVGAEEFCKILCMYHSEVGPMRTTGIIRDVFGDPQGIDPLFHLSSLEGFKIGLALTLLFSVWFVLCFGLFFIFVVDLTVFSCFRLFLFSLFARFSDFLN